MNRAKKFFVFDFDGVICDSTDECMVTSWNAWQRWNGKNHFRTTLEEFTDREIDEFRPLRYYVRGAGEYYILRRLLSETNIKLIRRYEDFEIYQKQWTKEVNQFKEYIFRERSSLRERSLDDWINLHQVYPEIIDLLHEISKIDAVYIATLKDYESVKLILAKYNVFIPASKILHQAIISSKLQALDMIKDNEKKEKTDIYLFDDNINHLIDPFTEGYQVYQTTWGNVPADFIDQATEKNVPLIDFKGLKQLTSSIH